MVRSYMYFSCQGCKIKMENNFFLERTFVRLGHQFGQTKDKFGQTSYYYFFSFNNLQNHSITSIPILRTENISMNFTKKRGLDT